MSESKLAVEVAAVLDEFTAAQRAQAIGQARLQKLVFARQIGEGQIQFEAVIDETADAGEIYTMLSRVETAADRLKAKVDLSGHYARILNIVSQIEMSRKKLAEDAVKFDAQNAVRSAGRRIPIARTEQQNTALQQHGEAIREGFDRIAETEKAIAECRRILDGEEPFAVLAEQIAERLDSVRGSRAAAA